MSWLDDLLGCNIYEGGVFVKLRRNLNFVGVDAVDNTSTDAVDIYVAGARDWKESVHLATAAALPAYTFAGASDSIIANVNGAMPNVDGAAPVVGHRILLIAAGTTSDVHNGIWVVTSIGGVGSKWSLERDSLADDDAEITPGMHVYVERGTAYGTHRFVCTNTGTIVVNTTPITLVTMGSTMSLCTAALAGGVNAFTAATFMTLQGDGATAGGTWTASPGFGATPGATFRLNMTATEWIGWNGVHGIMIDGGGDMHIGDFTTTDDIFISPTTAVYLESGGVTVVACTAAAFDFATVGCGITSTGNPPHNFGTGLSTFADEALVTGDLTAASDVVLSDAGGATVYAAEFTGAGAAATTLIRGADTDLAGGDTGGPIHIRPGAGTAKGVLELQSGDGTSRFSVSGSGNITIAGNSYVAFTAGVSNLYLTGTYMEIRVPTLQFDDSEVTPFIKHLVDTTAGITGDDLTAAAQDVSDPAGNALSGDFGIRGGQGLVHANNKDGNLWLHVAPANWQAMEKGMFIADCVTAPTGNPANGGFLFSSAGSGTWRGSGGTITVFGGAAPRCSACGHDFWKQACCSPRFDAYLLECGMCGKVYKGGPESILAQLDSNELDELIYDDGDKDDPRPEHKKRTVIESLAGLAYRNKSAGPTLQEYRRQCSVAIDETEPVLIDSDEVIDVDPVATRAIAAAAIADIRTAWVEPWQSWRDLYSTRDDGVALVAQLDSDVSGVDHDTDDELAAHEWEAVAASAEAKS